MNKSRTVFLLIILGLVATILALFAWQNWSPLISLTFLGMNSQEIPFAISILVAFLAGIVTSLIIFALFGLSNHLAKPPGSSPRHSPDPEGPQPGGRTRDTNWESPTHSGNGEDATTGDRPPESDEASSSKTSFFKFKKGRSSSARPENVDDWTTETSGVENSRDDDWGEGHRSGETQKDDDSRQEPKTESWSGSVYSYGYKEPSGSAVGRTESVYDADYRVITPPAPRSPVTTSRASEATIGSNGSPGEQERQR